MGAVCRTCAAPAPIRDLVERMRTVNISYRDCAEVVKTIRGYDLSHAAIQRHEVEGHFEPNAVIASQVPDLNPEELTIKSMVTHKIKLFWQHHKDEIPNSTEIRAWVKLMADIREAEAEAEKAQMLRDMFLSRPALPDPNVITVQVLEKED